MEERRGKAPIRGAGTGVALQPTLRLPFFLVSSKLRLLLRKLGVCEIMMSFGYASFLCHEGVG